MIDEIVLTAAVPVSIATPGMGESPVCRFFPGTSNDGHDGSPPLINTRRAVVLGGEVDMATSEESISLGDVFKESRSLELSPGNVIAIYTDEGPSGPCAQAMSVTCPHATIHWFEDEESFRQWGDLQGPLRGRQAHLRYAVLGSYSAHGTMGVCWHLIETHGGDHVDSITEVTRVDHDRRRN